jgi:hypothetical protein
LYRYTDEVIEKIEWQQGGTVSSVDVRKCSSDHRS